MHERPLTRNGIAALARDPAACSLDALRAAIATLDHEKSAAIVFARAKRKDDLPIAETLPLAVRLVDVTLVEDLIAVSTGDRTAWIEGVRQGPRSREAAARDILLLWVAYMASRNTGVEVSSTFRAKVIHEGRRLARQKLDALGYVMLADIGAAIDDAHLTSATKHVSGLLTQKNKAALVELRKTLERGIDPIIATFPEVDETPRSAAFTIKTAPKPGRNELCHCGSGKKYKKCCADKDDAVSASPVAGMSWEDYIANGADRMSADDIDSLELADLARVDLTKLAEPALVRAIRTFTLELDWDRAIAGCDVLAARPDAADPEGIREELLMELLDRDELDRAEVQLAKLADPLAVDRIGVQTHRFEIALARKTATLADLETAAVHALTEATADADLAHTLLRRTPALGILVARGIFRAGRALDADVLAEMIEDARDDLALPPNDVAWEMLATLEKPEAEDDEDDEDTEQLRGSLVATTSKVEQLERELEHRKRELAAARETKVEVATVEPEHVRALKAKIESLEGLVREGNTERGELRRQLATASRGQTPDKPAAAAKPVDDESTYSDDLDEEARGIAIPQFERRVRDALDSVPQSVAADAMLTIGELAAGDEGCWARVKQAKDMAKQVLMARIGIHHRLLFRVENEALVLLDLVTREDLLTTLKKLRANKA